MASPYTEPQGPFVLLAFAYLVSDRRVDGRQDRSVPQDPKILKRACCFLISVFLASFARALSVAGTIYLLMQFNVVYL